MTSVQKADWFLIYKPPRTAINSIIYNWLVSSLLLLNNWTLLNFVSRLFYHHKLLQTHRRIFQPKYGRPWRNLATKYHKKQVNVSGSSNVTLVLFVDCGQHQLTFHVEPVIWEAQRGKDLCLPRCQRQRILFPQDLEFSVKVSQRYLLGSCNYCFSSKLCQAWLWLQRRVTENSSNSNLYFSLGETGRFNATLPQTGRR